MKHRSTRLLGMATTFAAAALLGACGGGGGGGGGSGYSGFVPAGTSTSGAGTGDTIPATALSSVDAFVAYMKGLIANSTSDTALPVVLGNAVLPVDDQREASGL